MPNNLPFLATVMALDLTCFTALHANRKASNCSSVGLVAETEVNSMSSGTNESESWLNHPPPTAQTHRRPPFSVSSLKFSTLSTFLSKFQALFRV